MATDPLDQAWQTNSAAAPASNPLGQSQASAASAPASSSMDAAWSGTSGASAPTPSASSANTAASSPQPATDVMSNLGVAPTGSAPAPSEGNDTRGAYATGLTAVQGATNPQDLMAKQDALARSVMSNLQSAGHQVTWDGTHLTVDGRPYEVAGQNAPASAVQGFDTGKLNDANYSSAKYTPAAKTFAQALAATGLDASTARGNLGPIAIYAQLNGFPNAQAVGDDKVDFGDGNGPIDVLTQQGQFWFQNGSDRPGGGGDGSGGEGSIASGPSSSAAAAAASLVAATGQKTDYNALWGGVSPTSLYTASAIGDENMPGFTYESLLADHAKNNPTTAATDRNVQSLLDNPDSVSQHTVDMMEAKDAEEQQQSSQQQDLALKRFGLQGGISDSPWLASERAATARAGDASIIGNRRNIELTAAQTNKADERAAAQIGSTYQDNRAKQQSQAVATAVEGAMKKALETSNRFSINENLKVEAAKLSMTADQLREQYAADTMKDLTSRYGIDLGVKVDAAKLSQQSEQFQSDLLYKLQALKQQASQFDAGQSQDDAQFGAKLGLSYDTLNADELDKYWDRQAKA